MGDSFVNVSKATRLEYTITSLRQQNFEAITLIREEKISVIKGSRYEAIQEGKSQRNNAGKYRSRGHVLVYSRYPPLWVKRPDKRQCIDFQLVRLPVIH